MTTKPQCEFCVYWVEIPRLASLGNPIFGKCHRQPPTGSCRCTSRIEREVQDVADFPVVHATDWCGDFAVLSAITAEP